ncbi:MAG TPA: hypothetical protein VGS02_02240 [Acidobacteriaceae bacterium]|nr:hypothetical protein [Acidobacteriaceae bacterium]
MIKGALLAIAVFIATGVLVAIGTIWPVQSAVYWAGGGGGNVLRPATTPEAAVEDLGVMIRLHDWNRAYNSLANKGEFTQEQFIHDLTSSTLSLRTYADLEDVDVHPLHQTDNDADVNMTMHWSSVVGPFENTRQVHLVHTGDRWAVDWPLIKEPPVPAQVIAVNYLRWDVIYPGSAEEWGAQQVEGPHVEIVDMKPVNRAAGVFVMGELLNQDVVPAWVDVRATLLRKDGTPIESEDAFDMMMHTLLPKQVTPFLIKFPGVDLSQVSSIRMDPVSVLVPASADPVIEVQNQKFNPGPAPTFTAEVSNQSGEPVNVAHVLTTFYDKNGQIVWVTGHYMDRALQPQTPVDFTISLPEDLGKSIVSQRTVVATYSTRNNA